MRFLFSLFIFFSYQGMTTDVAPPTFPEIFEYGPDSLHTAVYKGDIKKVRNHIKKGADVNGRDIKSDDIDLFLRVMGAIAPLHLVNDLEIARLLIKKGADVNIRTQKKLYLDESPSPTAPLSTPLHYAKTVEIARLFIEHGADVNAKNKYKETPLHFARDIQIARLLIEKGADVNAKNKYKVTPIHYVLRTGWDVFKLGWNRYKEKKFIKKQTEIIKFFLENNADINTKDKNGNTPLHNAFGFEVTKMLIRRGADVKAVGDFRRTPLHIFKHIETVKMLVAIGADVNAKDSQNKTPLHYVRNIEQARLLIEKGADVNAKDYDGKTPIFYAIGNREIFKFLVSKGADIKVKDRLQSFTYCRKCKISKVFNTKRIRCECEK